jgi:hypothetical protein
LRIPKPGPFAVRGIHTKCAIARKHSAQRFAYLVVLRVFGWLALNFRA